MKTYNILYTAIIALIFTSCENEIPFNVKGRNPKLTLNAIIDINSEWNYIFLSKTGKDDIDSVYNATINIYINDELKEQLTKAAPPDSVLNPVDSLYYEVYDYNYKNKKYRTDLSFRPGDKVRIEAFADDNKYHAWAEDVVPKPIEIEKIDTMSFVKDRSTYIRLRTTFTDFPNEKNFYRLALVQKTIYHRNTKEEDTEDIYTHSYNRDGENVIFMDISQDIVLNDGRVSTDSDIFPKAENSYAIFNDTHLNGTYTMTTSFDNPSDYYMGSNSRIDSISIDFTVHLISITEMLYYYMKALNLTSSDSYDEYFSMPVSYPSNVQGGVGFVGFSADTYKTFSIPNIVPNTTGWYGYDQ